jgi:hypothetical protein
MNPEQMQGENHHRRWLVGKNNQKSKETSSSSSYSHYEFRNKRNQKLHEKQTVSQN